ncbi:ArsR/SmtB family transcription factor [Halococcoides cellulosivorans]|uniref:Transcriptional regulator n=1 Tax=Halococcoides cellulosivorans TaxID=1679096 RepID=A0A2R4X182_9EURY|nr:metalloregulator ArsR/SmtB family transcription factor [Halococcoides cellulosivorans]AWB27548.1 transcriptional regulator [Halococcoides cellulosivorans]
MSSETSEAGVRPDDADTGGEACCTTVPAVDTDTIDADVQMLSALGNDTRYELVRRIRAADGDVCVCDLESAVGISQSGVSQALSRLSAAGLLTRRKEGSWRYYGVTDDAEQLLDCLDALRHQ